MNNPDGTGQVAPSGPTPSQGSVDWMLDGGIGRIVLRRPDKANALDFAMARQLAQAIHEVLSREPRVVLLAAEGTIFCAGGDIDEFVSVGVGLAALVDRVLELVHPAVHRLATAPIPVVSAVSGPIGGAGIGLALCADFVLASESMKLRTGYAALGLSPDLGASYFLARRVGVVRATQWFMLSDPVDARTCLDSGVVDAVYPACELAGAAEALVVRLAQAAPASTAAIKKLCESLQAGELQLHLQREHELLRCLAATADGLQRVRAFVERRNGQDDVK